MGLSIHYSGRLKDIILIPQLSEEVKEICETFQWTFHLFDDEDFKGICFYASECEPVFLTFNNTPALASPLLWQLKMETSPISVKTQFAGIDNHIALIKLLKYLKSRYFNTFELFDEGGYWESGDEEVLRKQFSRYTFILDAVCEALRDFKSEPGEATSSLADRLERFFKDRGETDLHPDNFR